MSDDPGSVFAQLERLNQAERERLMAESLRDLLDAWQSGKPWWQSRAIWGAVATMAASLLGLLGIESDTHSLTDALVLGATFVAGLVSWWGSVRRATRIDPHRVLPGVTVGQGRPSEGGPGAGS